MIPGVSTTGPFEVPTGGIVIDDEFYIWVTTDHSEAVAMGDRYWPRQAGKCIERAVLESIRFVDI